MTTAVAAPTERLQPDAGSKPNAGVGRAGAKARMSPELRSMLLVLVSMGIAFTFWLDRSGRPLAGTAAILLTGLAVGRLVCFRPDRG